MRGNFCESPVYGNSKLGLWLHDEAGTADISFELKDHLGNIRALLSKNNDQVTYTADYYPFGSVMREFGSKSRYGYQGDYTEKDDETGWNHFELREYDPVVGRWLSVDPYRIGNSMYIGMSNNPISLIDPDGGKPEDIIYYDKNGVEIHREIEHDLVDLFGLLDKHVVLSDADLANGTFVDYFYEDNGFPGHALIRVVATGEVFEAHNPTGPNGIESGSDNFKKDIINGVKSQVYRFDNLDPDSKFWTYLLALKPEGRGNLQGSRVWVPNKNDLLNHLYGQVGKTYSYNALFNNCKHFCFNAIEAGGRKLNWDFSEVPAQFQFKPTIFIDNPTR